MNTAPKRRWAVNLILVLGGGWVALMVGEGILRITKLPVAGIAHHPCIYLVDEQLGYRYRPNATGWIHRNFEMDNVVQINSAGFHDIEHEIGDSGALRILAVGDSFTAALSVDIQSGWTQTLQQELREAGYSSAEVVNLGLDGTGTDVHLAILEKYLPAYQPRLVILAFHEWDFDDVTRGRIYRECFEEYVLAFQDEDQRTRLRALANSTKSNDLSMWLFDNVYLFRTTMFFIIGKDNPMRSNFLSPKHIGIAIDEAAQNRASSSEILLSMKDLSQRYGSNLLIIPLPAKDGSDIALRALETNLSPASLEELNIVDLSPHIARLLAEEERSYREMFWLFDGHLGESGNSILGLAIGEYLLEHSNELIDQS